MVASRSGQRHHLVLPCKGGLIKCDSDCLNYKSMGICSHTVAVVQMNNNLPQFVSAFSKLKGKNILLALLFLPCHLKEGGKEDKLHVHERKHLSQLQIVCKDYHPALCPQHLFHLLLVK